MDITLKSRFWSFVCDDICYDVAMFVAQEAQLLQRGRATPLVGEFSLSHSRLLKVIGNGTVL